MPASHQHGHFTKLHRYRHHYLSGAPGGDVLGASDKIIYILKPGMRQPIFFWISRLPYNWNTSPPKSTPVIGSLIDAPSADAAFAEASCAFSAQDCIVSEDLEDVAAEQVSVLMLQINADHAQEFRRVAMRRRVRRGATPEPSA